MKNKVFCIKDARSSWLTPTFEANDSVAFRNFVHAVQTSGTVLTSHKEDFALYELGSFDNETGLFDFYAVPKLVVSGGDIS